VAVVEAMRAMSAADTAARDTAFVALLGRLRPMSPPGFFLADAVAFVPRGGMRTYYCRAIDLERC
jgi:hypothetical protein